MKSNFKNEIEFVVHQFKKKNFVVTINKINNLLKKNPVNDFLINLRGLSFQATNKLDNSIEDFRNSIKLNPKNIAAMNNLGNSLKYLNNIKEAEKCYMDCLNINSNHVGALNNLANLKSLTNFTKEAITILKKSLSIDENLEVTHINLAQALQNIGEFDESKDVLIKALIKFPNLTKADKLLSSQINYNLDNTHLTEMLNKQRNINLNNEQKTYLYFAISKAYEDQKKYKESFEYFSLGNELKRNSIKFNINDKIKLFDSLKSNYSKFNYHKNELTSDKKIIFIFGLPRSGTTLVEKILSSHKEISSVGEINYLNKFISLNLIKNSEIDVSKLESFDKNKIINDYLNHLKNFNINTNIVTDKSLGIYWYLGIIKYFFPEAKLIHCHRNIRDNYLSILKNLFEEGEGWKFNELELVQYLNLYSKIMKFWNTNLKNEILHINYENLITNNETETRNLIKFCELDWDENCLKHYKSKSPIRTLSVNQANKPIYHTSINISKNFEKFLNKYFNQLD